MVQAEVVMNSLATPADALPIVRVGVGRELQLRLLGSLGCFAVFVFVVHPQ